MQLLYNLTFFFGLILNCYTCICIRWMKYVTLIISVLHRYERGEEKGLIQEFTTMQFGKRDVPNVTNRPFSSREQ